MEYIEREKAIENFSHLTTVYPIAKNLLNELPAADVVSVVRCRDCQFWNENEKNLNGYCRCDVFAEWQFDADRPCFPPDGFCSKGQPRAQ